MLEDEGAEDGASTAKRARTALLDSDEEDGLPAAPSDTVRHSVLLVAAWSSRGACFLGWWCQPVLMWDLVHTCCADGAALPARELLHA